MYLSRLKLWDFRKFGSASAFDLKTPNLDLPFNPGVNLLIGENDSGKTGIIDAIKLVLNTHSYESNRIDDLDFHSGKLRFRIECEFRDLKDAEAKNFIEWLSWDTVNGAPVPFLSVKLDVSRTNDRILFYDYRAGSDDEGYILTSEARSYLKATYLRPLRDARQELTPKKNSRLSQVLLSHDAFKTTPGVDHDFVTKVKELNNTILEFFEGKDGTGTALAAGKQTGKELKEIIDGYLDQFWGRKSKFGVNGDNIRNILESLFLIFENELNLGLGSHNLLCIAAELLHLQKTDWDGLRLGLIEEIEAHLHPQVQLQVIETLKQETNKSGVQLLLTTHSPNIGAKIPLSNLILCHNSKAFPMGENFTKLESTDYQFLERFLDTTKANLFFAKGVILVEGWGEELLLSSLANKLGINLTKHGVSIVNIGNTAFLRYCKIFQRKTAPSMDIPVAVLTDVDVQPLLAGKTKAIPDPANAGNQIEQALTKEEIEVNIAASIKVKEEKYTDQKVKGFISPFWTLEYCIALSPSLRKLFYKSVLQALREQKIDDGVKTLTSYDNAIADIDNHFINWTESGEEIAYKIMNQILTGANTVGVAKAEISKSIIAQIFSKNLSESIEDFALDAQPSIKYLLDAIRYASNN